MIFPTLRFQAKKPEGPKQMQTNTLRVNLRNLGVYQKHLTLEWHLVKLAPAGLGLPGGCVFEERTTTLEGCHRSAARRRRCMCAETAPRPPPGMTFPACLCLAPRAREIYGSLSSKEFSCSNDEPRCLISTKFSANQLVILFHNTKLIKRRGARISEGVNKRLASSEKLLRKRVTYAFR